MLEKNKLESEGYHFNSVLTSYKAPSELWVENQ